MSDWLWDSSFSVGIDVIDGQHRRIIDYINAISAAKRVKDSDKVARILLELVDYTRTHFLFEEELMKQAGYPLSGAHKKVHDAFVANIHKYVQQHDSGKDIVNSLSSQLQIWLMNHIKKDDKDYAPYVIKMTKQGWIRKTLSRFFG